mmetsp:Transcript_42155/g.113697  ORF Transcript_42155/g.113697 Transcript_42155/m.113697 type:complete len:210 (-) Transcript_42155:283-912(-)
MARSSWDVHVGVPLESKAIPRVHAEHLEDQARRQAVRLRALQDHVGRGLVGQVELQRVIEDEMSPRGKAARHRRVLRANGHAAAEALRAWSLYGLPLATDRKRELANDKVVGPPEHGEHADWHGAAKHRITFQVVVRAHRALTGDLRCVELVRRDLPYDGVLLRDTAEAVKAAAREVAAHLRHARVKVVLGLHGLLPLGLRGHVRRVLH